MPEIPGGEVVVYETSDSVRVEVRLERETAWLTQQQMADLFGRERSVITKHLRNVFKEGELEEKSNVQNLHIPGSDKPVKFFNLDVIISVGYRVKSKRGTQFRIWATKTLREHLVRGYTLNRQRFEHNARELEAALAMVRKASMDDMLTDDQGRGLVEIITRYTQTFLLLQRYDEGLLKEPKGTKGGTLPDASEAREAIRRLKDDLTARGKTTALFGQEQGDGLVALIGNLNQSVLGKPAYPTLESKAAHLLYFIIKNHPFVDGNKRIGSFLLMDFLNRNGRLFRQSQPVINDMGLAALALLVAESSPKDKEVMIHLIMNMLAEPPP